MARSKAASATKAKKPVRPAGKTVTKGAKAVKPAKAAPSKPAASKATNVRAAKAVPASKPSKPSKPSKAAKPAAIAPLKPTGAPKAAASTPRPVAKSVAAPAKASTPAPVTKVAPARPVSGSNLAKLTPPAPARFGFEAQPLVRDAAALTPLLRQQLVWNARLSVGRLTTPDRVPASYFAVGLVRWRITEKGKPLFDIVQNTAFMAGTDEPAGLERRGGLWVATGRGAQRGLALDLIGVAWDLNRDWPGRRLPLPPEPRRGTKLKPEPLVDGEPFPSDTAFV